MLKILTNNIKEVGYDIKDEAKLSAIFGIGNGYFGIRGSFEEFGDVFVQGCYIRGAFDEIIEIPATFADNIYMKKYYFDVQKLKTFEYQDSCINLFDPTTIKIYVNGKMFLPWEGKIIKWERYIDFKTGGLIRKVIWDDGKGNQSEFHFERYCSFANNHLFFQKVSITKLNHNLDMVIDMGIDTLVKTNGQHKSKIVYINNTKDNVDLIANLGHKYNMNVALSSKNFVNNCEFIKTLENNKVYSSAYMMKSKSAELFKVVCVYLNIDGVEDILSSCKNDLEGISYQNIYLNHIKAYKKSFDKINVKIEGNNKINILLKYANYQTLIGFDRYDSIHSLSAKNLTAEKYNQFVWWDAEIFQLPFLIYNFPKAARSCLEYRYRCLNKAKENAKNNGYKGAQYAFCSSVYGDEKVWEYARHPFLQIHISSDVAYGIYNYYRATKDRQFMLSMGMEMIIEILKFFYSRCKLKDGYLNLYGVTGTDEHHPYVNNNAYTNYEVKYISDKTLNMISELNYSISLDDLNLINQLSKLMYLPKPNRNGIIPQFDGYLDLKPYLPLAGNGAAKGFQMKASGLYNESQIIKQPDVMNLFTYVDVELDEKLYKKNWKYYEKMCEASSSLTFPVHTICAIDNHEFQKFEKLLIDTLTIDISDIHNCAYQGVHAGCLAGGWFAIFRGVFGIKPFDDGLIINPKSIPSFKKVKINFEYKNVQFSITIEKDKATLISKNDANMIIINKGHKMFHHKVSILKI